MNNFNGLVKIATKYFHLPTVKKSKHFSFILLRGKLYTWGWNQRLQLDDVNNHQYTRHSEAHAIDRLNAELRNRRDTSFSKFTIVNVRINRLGTITESYPCYSCLKLITTLGFKHVYCTNREGNFIHL